jgi:hypothetical protein
VVISWLDRNEPSSPVRQLVETALEIADLPFPDVIARLSSRAAAEVSESLQIINCDASPDIP